MRIRPVVYFSFACAVALAQPSTAADLSKNVQALQKTVGTLQKQLDQEKRKNANTRQIEQKFEKRVAELEKTGGLFNKTQIPLENKVKASGGSASMTFGTATFTGVLKSNSLIAESVISKSYAPGAGNVW